MVNTCQKPNCSWLALPSLRDLKSPPPLTPNPELSGIGAILGFSITAYLTVLLLLFHYIFVYKFDRVSSSGKEYTNPVDHGVLTYIRQKIISWTPSRRFEYAMEKSVLILSDTQLVTGLAILIAGYSQLPCGISSYHWQIMVYVAWFSSFTFLSAMAFLEGYFQTNSNLRLIRVFFICILGGLMVAALLPTGSRNWLDAAGEDGPLYAGLSAQCFFEQLTMPTYTTGGPRVYSMIFSILVVSFSYVHSGIKLFDPTAQLTRKYLRGIPGYYLKKLLYLLERKATRPGIRASLWVVPYVFVFWAFTSIRAVYDVAESMLAEIIWLSFAMGWGSIKVWDTRELTTVSKLPDGSFIASNDTNDDDFWSFGQTLPLVLLLLPILAMAQSYLDNDAKAQEAVRFNPTPQRPTMAADSKQNQTMELGTICSSTGTGSSQRPDARTSASLRRLSIPHRDHHHPSPPPSHTNTGRSSPASSTPEVLPSSHPSTTTRSFPHLISLPRHPYHSFYRYDWYRDHVYLLVCHSLMLGCVILWLESEVLSILGISYFLRSRLMLLWVFGFVPLSGGVHLVAWYLGANVVARIDGAEDWLRGRGRWRREREGRWWARVTLGQWVFWVMRTSLKVGCLLLAFLTSAQIAGPEMLDFSDG